MTNDITDLEKVTDYAEDKEILSTGNELEEAIVNIRKKQEQKKAEKMARERELAKVSINKEDVELIMTEMELPKVRSNKTMREMLISSLAGESRKNPERTRRRCGQSVDSSCQCTFPVKYKTVLMSCV